MILNIHCEVCDATVAWDTDQQPEHSVIYVGDDILRFDGVTIVCSKSCAQEYIDRLHPLRIAADLAYVRRTP